MADSDRHQKPRGFGVFTRIVFVHQAFFFALFIAGLQVHPVGGIDERVLPHLWGIAVSVALLVAMFGVAIKKSLQALFWLRVLLWVGVVNFLMIQLWQLAHGQTQVASSIRTLLINELISIPVALYWSRSVHVSYLASLSRSGGSAAG